MTSRTQKVLKIGIFFDILGGPIVFLWQWRP